MFDSSDDGFLKGRLLGWLLCCHLQWSLVQYRHISALHIPGGPSGSSPCLSALVLSHSTLTFSVMWYPTWHCPFLAFHPFCCSFLGKRLQLCCSCREWSKRTFCHSERSDATRVLVSSPGSPWRPWSLNSFSPDHGPVSLGPVSPDYGVRYALHRLGGTTWSWST